ncbi:MAG: hypothetical protein U0Y08_06890 [Bacteroidia bacterium]
MITFLHILVVFLLGWWWYRRDDKITVMAMGVLVAFKAVTGMLFAEYYLRTYGGGDMHNYWADALTLRDLFNQDPVSFLRLIFLNDDSAASVQHVLPKLQVWYDSGFRGGINDARTVVRFHSLLALFSGGNILVHLIWSNVLAVAGLKWMFGFFVGDEQGRGIPYGTWMLALLPNVLLWSSPLLKEPLMLFTMGAFFESARLLRRNFSPVNMVLLLLSMLGSILIKYFWLLLLVPGLLAYLFFPSGKRNGWGMGVMYVCCFGIVLIAGHLIPSLHLPSLLFGQQLNMWRFAVYWHAGTLIDPVPFAPTDWSLIRHLPYAFVYTLVQPLPSQVSKLPLWPMCAESIFSCILLLAALIVRVRRRAGSSFLATYGLIAGACIMIISGFTTPVLGTLIRYRMPGLLLLLLAAVRVLRELRSSPPNIE